MSSPSQTASPAAQRAAPPSAAVEAAVLEAVSLVCDPEYPQVTIAELGMLHRVAASDDGTRVRIELIPTMLGCPALDLIARDVVAAARTACDDLWTRLGCHDRPLICVPEAVFLDDPVWTPERIAASAVEFLAREYTVAVRIGTQAPVCPKCKNPAMEHSCDFGPVPCRSIAWCSQCRNPIEVVGRPAQATDAAVEPAAMATSTRPARPTA